MLLPLEVLQQVDHCHDLVAIQALPHELSVLLFAFLATLFITIDAMIVPVVGHRIEIGQAHTLHLLADFLQAEVRKVTVHPKSCLRLSV